MAHKPTRSDSGHPDRFYFSDTLHGVLPKMKARERQVVQDMLLHYEAQFRAMKREDPTRIAYTLHCLVDDRIKTLVDNHPRAKDISCKRGCDACCHVQVDIIPHEARLAITYAAEQRISLDLDLLDGQRNKTLGDWMQMPKAARRCVFLGAEGECRVYEHRPAACRKYHVITDPTLCDTVEHPGGIVGRIFSVEAEVIDSAAMTALHGHGNMADVLLQILEEEPRDGNRPR